VPQAEECTLLPLAGAEEGTIHVYALWQSLRGNPVGVQVHSVELITACTQHVHAFFMLRGSGCGVLRCNGEGDHYVYPPLSPLCVFKTLDIHLPDGLIPIHLAQPFSLGRRSLALMVPVQVRRGEPGAGGTPGSVH
jgi:hypothetical protein